MNGTKETPFKVCSSCNKVWQTREEFISDTTHIGDWKETGLALYNCECKTTLSIELYKGSMNEAREKRLKGLKK